MTPFNFDGPKVYDYDDYRKYLSDFVKYRKQQGMPASYRWFSQRAGFSSPNYLHLVLTHKRHLSLRAIEGTVRAFKLSPSDADFFRILVLFNRSANALDRTKFGNQLLLKRMQTDFKLLEQNQFAYYLSWKNIAIRESLLLDMKTGLSIEDIQACVIPRLEISEIEDSLKILESIRLVQKNENKKWKANSMTLTSGDRVSSSSLISYHLQMIDLARKALLELGPNEREISNVSVPLTTKTFEYIRSRIQDLKKEILALSKLDSHSDKVIQINFQLFPIAKRTPLT